MRSLVWFRGKDLRLTDHAPLADGIEGGEVVPLFVLDPYFFEPERAVELPHRMQFLLDGLVALHKNLLEKGSRLLLVKEASITAVPRLARELGIDRVLAYRWSEPVGRKRDAIVEKRLHVPLHLYEGETLLPPQTVRTRSGSPFAVYTPFARAAREALLPPRPLAAPRELPPLPQDVEQRKDLFREPPGILELGLERNARLLQGGEKAALQRARPFLSGGIERYATERDQMGEEGTSRLSADLKFGTISVGWLWDRVSRLPPSESKDRYQAQLLWREFAYSILWDRPGVLTSPFRPEFEKFPWGFDQRSWDAWVEGKTGYPIVDASARQLLQEGYVHNRARMISASFLTKHLLIDYRHGEAHYLKFLTDGDWALNNLGWQWSAGCGVDAQPYFRVFNPMTQGQRYDARGAYVRRYVPELGQLPDKYIHRPWEAPARVLTQAGVQLGKDYPWPVVQHAEARSKFLVLAKNALAHRR